MSTSRQFYELTDAELVTWANHFSELLTLSPTSYTLSAANASEYAAAAADFEAKQSEAANADTRGPASIFARNQSRDALIAITRQFANVIQAALTVTDEQRQELGLHIRDFEPTPINPPVISPVVTVVAMVGRTATLRFSNPLSPNSRRRPAGVQGVTVFSCVGPAPLQAGDAGWLYQGQTGKNQAFVQFSNAVPAGSKVWFCAVYYNPRGEIGPISTPVSTYLPLEDAQQAA